MLIKSVYGNDIKNYVNDLAALRIEVFKEYPYLYDGSLEAEKAYLEYYSQSKDSIILLVEDQGSVVGATTGIPLAQADYDFRKPFENKNYNIDDIFYLGESVLLPKYRGQNFGNKFFQRREEFAKSLGYNNLVFCSVNRDKSHPLKPDNYRALDDWWIRLGYKHYSDLVCKFSWKEVDEKEEVLNSLTFWQKSFD